MKLAEKIETEFLIRIKANFIHCFSVANLAKGGAREPGKNSRKQLLLSLTD